MVQFGYRCCYSHLCTFLLTENQFAGCMITNILDYGLLEIGISNQFCKRWYNTLFHIENIVMGRCALSVQYCISLGPLWHCKSLAQCKPLMGAVDGVWGSVDSSVGLELVCFSAVLKWSWKFFVNFQKWCLCYNWKIIQYFVFCFVKKNIPIYIAGAKLLQNNHKSHGLFNHQMQTDTQPF